MTHAPGDFVKAKVTGVSNHGLTLRCDDGLEVFVSITDVEWYRAIPPSNYARVGDRLDVKLLQITSNGSVASGWLPWPTRQLNRRHETTRHRLSEAS